MWGRDLHVGVGPTCRTLSYMNICSVLFYKQVSCQGVAKNLRLDNAEISWVAKDLRTMKKVAPTCRQGTYMSHMNICSVLFRVEKTMRCHWGILAGTRPKKKPPSYEGSGRVSRGRG
mgnify:CR=1 FL=1